LKLTKTILPDLLPLLNLDDYKSGIMRLLGQMVDSNLVTTKDYEMYFSKFLVEVKQELKKQKIVEKSKAIKKAEEDKLDKNEVDYSYDNEEKDKGNDDLGLYAKLLLPFGNTNPAVMHLLQQMLASSDKKLKYSTMLLMLKNKKPYPDSLLTYFAGIDDYRYKLYSDLKELKLSAKFPSSYNNHLDLAKAALLDKQVYQKPDSVVYLDRLQTEYLGKKGYIYFFKYRAKKDDIGWLLACVGLVPENPKEFEFGNTKDEMPLYSKYRLYSSGYNKYDFTEFTTTKIDEEKPIDEQLRKQLKKLLYSRRKSGKMFYNEYGAGSRMHDYYD
jgi:hypothetical protein